MGLGIQTTADLPARGLLRRRPGRDQVFAAVRDAAASFVADPLLERFVRVSAAGAHALAVTLYPGTEPVEFTWDPTGSLAAAVKTSTAGPGFHAHCVALLDAVGERLGARWAWPDGADETGYATSRDFTQLQDEMAMMLRGLAGFVLQPDDGEPYASLCVNWPLGGATPHVAGFTVTPVGPRDEPWWHAVRDAAPRSPRLRKLAAEFFPWWSRGADGAAFWRATGLMMLWSEVRWHPPIDEEQSDACQLALACLDRARALDPPIALPETEIDELRWLTSPAASKEAAKPPSSAGIGYFRRTITFNLTGAWTIRLPGYFYQHDEEDGGTVVLYYGTRTVRASSFTLRGRDGKPAPAADLVNAGRDDAEAAGEPAVEWSDGRVAGRAAVTRVTDDPAEPYWQLQGNVAVDGNVCVATILYADAADRQWAIDTFRTLNAPPDDDADAAASKDDS